MKLLYLILLFFGLTSCSIYYKRLMIKTKTEYTIAKNNKNFLFSCKLKKQILFQNYVNFDKKGNIKEECEYGEESSQKKIVKYPNGSEDVILVHSYKFKNKNKSHYYQYDSINRIISDEYWNFIENKKTKLLSKIIYEYGTNGQLSKETMYHDGKINCINYHQYDSDNKKIIDEHLCYGLENNMQLMSKTIYNYDINGQLSKVTEFREDSSVIKLHEYYKKGSNNFIEVIIEGRQKDSLISDSLGRPLEKIEYFRENFQYRLVSRKLYIYDKLERLITELYYECDSIKPEKLAKIIESKYNNYHQLTEKIEKLIGEEIEVRDVYIYNRKNLLVKILHYEGNKIEWFTKYKYKLY